MNPANEISPSFEVVTVKEEMADYCVLQDENVLEGEEAMDKNDKLNTLEKPEYINDNMHYSSSLNEEHHVTENFLNIVKKETEFNLMAEEIQIKGECLFEATNSYLEDISNNKSTNERTNKPDHLNDELDSEHSAADDDKMTSENEFSAQKKPENINDNMQYTSSLCEERPVEKFLNKVKKETGFNLIDEEIQIKDERLFEATDSDSEDCNSTSSEDVEMKGMDQNVNNTKRLSCDECHRKFTYPYALKRHSLIHTKERPFKCDICEKTFSRSGTLNRHKLRHTGEKPYECDVCNKKFLIKHELIRHIRRLHTGEKPFHCQLCQYRGAEKNALKKHMRKHKKEKPSTNCYSEDGKKQYKCNECHKIFKFQSNFSRHKLIHTNKRTFKCEICEKTFLQLSYLKKHKLTHPGAYKCDACNKAFALESQLVVHKQTHNNERVFKCSLCFKSYTNSTALTDHMKRHTRGKPFHCPFCEYKFAQVWELKRHMRTHTGEKPFSCKHCNKAFIDVNYLKRHEQNIHSDKI